MSLETMFYEVLFEHGISFPIWVEGEDESQGWRCKCGVEHEGAWAHVAERLAARLESLGWMDEDRLLWSAPRSDHDFRVFRVKGEPSE